MLRSNPKPKPFDHLETAQLVMPPAPWCQPVQDSQVPQRSGESAIPRPVQKPAQNSTQEMAQKLKELKELFPTLQNMQDKNVVGTSVTKTPEGHFKLTIKCDKPNQVLFGENEGHLSDKANPKSSLGQLKKIDFAAEQSFTVVPDGKGNYQVKDIKGITATVKLEAFGKSVEVATPLPPYIIGADGQVKDNPGPAKEIMAKIKQDPKELLQLIQQLDKSDDKAVTLTRDGNKLEVRQENKKGKITEVAFTKTGANAAHIVSQSSEGTMQSVPGHRRLTQIVEPQVTFDLKCHDNGNIDVANMSGSYVTRHALIIKGVVGGIDRLSYWRDALGGEHLSASGWQRGPLGRTKPLSRSLDNDLNQGRGYK